MSRWLSTRSSRIKPGGLRSSRWTLDRLRLRAAATDAGRRADTTHADHHAVPGPLDDRGLAPVRPLTVLGRPYERPVDLQARAALVWAERDTGQMKALRQALVERRLGMIAADAMA